jgi:hypothetical protein
MVAGPWFAVRQDDAGWFDFGTVWWSDGGRQDGEATVQLSVDLEEREVPGDG